MTLVLLFNQGSEEVDLPDLYIRDAESGLNVPVAGIHDWDNDFLQVQSLCYGPMSFTDLTALVLDTETDIFWCRRLSKILLNLEFSTASASCEIYPIFHDQNDVKILGTKITITASDQNLGGTNYVSPMTIFDTYGARKVSFLPVVISAGTVYFRVTGV